MLERADLIVVVNTSDELMSGIASELLEHGCELVRHGDRIVELARPGDRIVIMGAGDDTLSAFAADVLARLDHTDASIKQQV